MKPARYACTFYREGRAARTFRFVRWADALTAAGRFSERLGAVCVIRELARIPEPPSRKVHGVLHAMRSESAYLGAVESPALEIP